MDEEQGKSREKYSRFMRMKKKIRETHHVIAQFFQENREFKRKIAEKDFEEQTPQNKEKPKNERSKVKEAMQIPEITILSNPTKPLTRSSTKKNNS
jgi:hypothetical protein